jgi:hypothetical protein
MIVAGFGVDKGAGDIFSVGGGGGVDDGVGGVGVAVGSRVEVAVGVEGVIVGGAEVGGAWVGVKVGGAVVDVAVGVLIRVEVEVAMG